MKYFLPLIFLALAITVSAQTFQSIDINPGPGNSNIEYFTQAGDKLFFAAVDSLHGRELWVTDGTPAGTHVIDTWVGRHGTDPQDFMVYNNKLYYSNFDNTGNHSLWVSDGTDTGTYALKSIIPGIRFPGGFKSYIVYNGKLYFSAFTYALGGELWVTDGTTNGTELVKDINPDAGSSSPHHMEEVNGKICFWINTDDNYHIWTSDGTTAGTQLLWDACFTEGSSPQFMPYNGKLYYANSGDGGNKGVELWSTDGTVAGTVLVKDIIPGTFSSQPGIGDYMVFNNLLYFSAYDSNFTFKRKLWRTDGTEAGTVKVSNVSVNGVGSVGISVSTYGWKEFNGRLYFCGTVPETGQELYSTDGTLGGTAIVEDFHPGTYPLAPTYLNTYHGKLYFAGIDSLLFFQFFESDGLAGGTHMVCPTGNCFSSYPFFLNGVNAVINDIMVFTGNYDSTGYELWFYKTDGINSVQEPVQNKLVCYPNPFKDVVNITGTVNGEVYNLALYDQLGRLAIADKQTGSNGNITLKTPDLLPGIYYLKIQTKDKVITQKIIKQN